MVSGVENRLFQRLEKREAQLLAMLFSTFRGSFSIQEGGTETAQKKQIVYLVSPSNFLP